MAERMPQFEYKEFQGIQLPLDFTVTNPVCEFPPDAPDAPKDGVAHTHKGEQPRVIWSGQGG